jgi:hypothetical protein
MAEEKKRWYRRRSATWIGPIWFIGWLFTIGYANLVWWQTILAIVPGASSGRLRERTLITRSAGCHGFRCYPR